MKTLGIVGGIAPESTIDYYRSIIATYRARVRDGSYPPLVINSIDLARLLSLIGEGRLTEVTAYLGTALDRLASAGADLGLLASNTPRIVFEDLQRRSPVPLISIVETVCAAARDLGLSQVGLFGTRFTMQGRFYPKVFEGHGIGLSVPTETEQTYIHDKYMGELVEGVFLEETRSHLLAIAARMKAESGIQGLILGGTELPLLLRDAPDIGLTFLDSTTLHVERAVALMLGDGAG